MKAMITDKEIPTLISSEVPDFARHDKDALQEHTENSKGLFNFFAHFTDYTICSIKNHEWNHVKRSFHFAEDVYNHGSAVAREAIENLFVYRITNLIDVIENRDHVIDLMPPAFQQLRLHQIYNHGN